MLESFCSCITAPLIPKPFPFREDSDSDSYSDNHNASDVQNLSDTPNELQFAFIAMDGLHGLLAEEKAVDVGVAVWHQP